jgi:hypothetical protein
VWDIFVLVALLIAGIVLGYVLREKVHVDFGRVTFGAVLVLIFCMGFSFGSNNDLLASLPRIGLSAVVILLFALLFSVVFMKLAVKAVRLE